MRSFPSGHAQLSSFTAIFAIVRVNYHWRYYAAVSIPSCVFQLYLQRRLQQPLLKRLLQLAFASFAVVASASRISDRRHHWWDVAVGCALGTLSAILAVKYRCRGFQDHDWSARLTSQEVTPVEKEGKSS